MFHEKIPQTKALTYLRQCQARSNEAFHEKNQQTNALAFLLSMSVAKAKKNISFTLGVNVIKLFFFVAEDEAK